MLKALIKVGTTVVLVVVGVICLILLGCQRSIIYYPRSYSAVERDNAKRFWTEIAYRTGEGRQVAYYIPPPGGTAPDRIWAVTSGNGSLAMDWLDFAVEFGEPATGFLLIDYPGYGANEGKASPSSIRESSRAALGALAEGLGIPEGERGGKVAILGHSLGAAAGLMLANDVGAERAVLIAPFTTMHEMARRSVGTPLNYLLLHPFDNTKELAEMVERGGRVTIFHGSHDGLIPPTMGQELAAAYPEGTVAFTLVDQAGHNDIIGRAGAAIREAMRAE